MSWPVDPLRRIACAVDGSSTSLQAADAAIELAARSDAELVLIHVLDDERLRDFATVMDDDGAGARRRLEQSAERMLGDLAERAGQRQVRCTHRVEEGDPPRAIDDVSRKVGADVILVGKVGRRGVRRWMVGSVTRRLIESTRIPVLVISGPGDRRGSHPGAAP
jgi:nucleotide-binding universal stress UspA family protein